ncbi:MAG: trimeric intracellular cation channel family protein [Leptolyngbyaceae cyanobacterium RM2_2_4]|nr:trimeric intracellular cation channel family protein [Leptolyngbyaceae cyanobacterium RM2_2_4]
MLTSALPRDTAIAYHLQRLAFFGYVIEVGAVITAAFSGMLAAQTKQLDLVGIYIVAFVNAFGGGTLRDLLLNRRPLFWVEHQEYPLIVLLMAIIFLYAPRISIPHQPVTGRLFTIVDAMGLALFSILGTSYALTFRMPYLAASIIGVITGVFGGVLRDVLLAQIPMIFRTATSLYATCAFAGSWTFLLAVSLDLPTTAATFLGFVVTVVLRMLSLRYGITLPQPHYIKQQHSSKS